MKKTLLSLVLLFGLAGLLHSESGPYSGFNPTYREPNGGPFVDLTLTGDGNDTLVSSVTISAISGGGEPRAWSLYGTYSSAEDGNLVMGDYTLVEYSTSGTTSDHVVSKFGRFRNSAWTEGFGAGVEGNGHCSSIISSAYCSGVIGHAVWLGVMTTTPTAETIGQVARAEIVDPTDATLGTPRVGNIDADIIGYESQTYGGYGDKRRNYNFRGLTTFGKVHNLGPGIFTSTYTQTVAAGFTILPQCGGVTAVTAASAVTSDTTNTFSAPSTSLSTGLGNASCHTTLVNTGSFAVTLDTNANFFTRGGIDVYFPTAASMDVVSTGSTWAMAGPVSYNALADIYVSSVTASASVATSGQFGNAGQVSITPGDWSVSAVCDIAANGATVTQTAMAISVNTGNTTTDHVRGSNQIQLGLPATVSTGGSIPSYRVAVAATTTVYVKGQATYSVATPTQACRITAERR